MRSAERRVISRHALRNALIPTVTYMGLQFAGLLGGAIVTEQVFSIPGVGRLNLVCQAGVDGQRTAILETGSGGTVITRESTWDGAVPQAVGPIVVRLPNNGQVQVDVASGARMLISSRWKANDPDPTQNFCAVAAQVVAP